jgi:hypothetical protein
MRRTNGESLPCRERARLKKIVSASDVKTAALRLGTSRWNVLAAVSGLAILPPQVASEMASRLSEVQFA